MGKVLLRQKVKLVSTLPSDLNEECCPYNLLDYRNSAGGTDNIGRPIIVSPKPSGELCRRV